MAIAVQSNIIIAFLLHSNIMFSNKLECIWKVDWVVLFQQNKDSGNINKGQCVSHQHSADAKKVSITQFSISISAVFVQFLLYLKRFWLPLLYL